MGEGGTYPYLPSPPYTMELCNPSNLIQLVELYSCTGGSWNGPVWCNGFPFTAGKQNEAVVVVGEYNYEVIVKGTDFSCKYNHYTPPESVETVQATHGKVEFARVSLQ